MSQVFHDKMPQIYDKMQQLFWNASISLQNTTVVTKCDVYYKVRWYTPL